MGVMNKEKIGFYHNYINDINHEVCGFNLPFGKTYDLGEAYNALFFKKFKKISLTIWPSRRWGRFFFELNKIKNNPHFGKGFSISIGIGLFQKWIKLSYRSWQ